MRVNSTQSFCGNKASSALLEIEIMVALDAILIHRNHLLLYMKTSKKGRKKEREKNINR